MFLQKKKNVFKLQIWIIYLGILITQCCPFQGQRNDIPPRQALYLYSCNRAEPKQCDTLGSISEFPDYLNCFFFKEPSAEVFYPTFVTLLNLMIRSWQIDWSYILDFSSPDTFNLSLILLMERGKVNSILKASLTKGLFNITTCRQELVSLTLYLLYVDTGASFKMHLSFEIISFGLLFHVKFCQILCQKLFRSL